MTPRNLHLVVDARRVVPEATGVGNYVAGLLGGLDGIAGGRGWRVTAVRLRSRSADSEWPETFWSSLRNVTTVETDADPTVHPRSEWWLQTGLPKIVRRVGGDVLFSPAFECPWGPRRFRRILTIHDAIAWDMPRNYSPKFASWLRFMASTSARSADAVLTDSPFAARRLRGRGIGGRRDFGVLPPGVDHRVFRPAEADESRGFPGGFRPSGPVVVVPGSLEPRKNQSIVSDAARLEPLRSRQHSLMFLHRPVGASPSPDSRHPAGPQEMAQWLRAAQVVAIPSRMEGFGMSLLEAMATGTPVVASDIPPHRWIAKGNQCARLVAPDDAEEWSRAIGEVIENGDAVQWCAANGLVGARQFTWERGANRLLDVADRLARSV